MAQLYAVDIVGVSKSFVRRAQKQRGYSSIKSLLLSPFTRSHTAPQRHLVIDDLTMRIPRGASVGLIGRNGQGKSTFLKLLTGIYKPDSGTIQVHGRIAALIELGAGFHPDFTGRENVLLGGVMHGLTRSEVEERFDDIVSFAELESVIDDPVRTYSSGMFMRLGFSLAVHTDPDVLLVDEVLAVGDAGFVAKCKDKISEMRKAGKTLVLVTHDLEAVERWCDEALWLHGGEVRERGEPRRVIDTYRQFIEDGEEAALEEKQAAHDAVEHTPEEEKALLERWGSREVEITSVRLLADGGTSRLLFHPQDSVEIEIAYKTHEPVDDVVFGVSLNRTDGLVAHGTNTDIEHVVVPKLQQEGLVRYAIRRVSLADGTYTIDVAVHRRDGYPYDYHKGAIKFAVRSPVRQVGVYVPDASWHF
jgi:lipopolysaccharide transport system ATP-binding protein